MTRDSAIKYNLAGSGDTEGTDDTISITSTPYDSDDSQAEYNVEDILAQDDDMDGVTKYLVRWTGYPLEKCTWEPAENMGPELLHDLWEKKKKKRGYQPFDISLFNGAVAEKEGRHLRRNIKRKRLGLPQTFPFLDDDGSAAGATSAMEGETPNPSEISALAVPDKAPGEPMSKGLLDITQGSDEDLVVLEDLSAPAAPKKPKKKKQDAQHGKGKSKEDLKPAPKTKGSTETGSSRPTSKAAAIGLAASSALRSQPKQAEKRASVDDARKPSPPKPVPDPNATAASSRHLSDQKGSDQPSGASPSNNAGSSSDKNGQIKTFSAKKSAKVSQVAGNAFISGKKIRTRPNLIAAMADPTKPQHLFSSRRTLRIAELQERDKPDGILDPSRLTTQLFPISKGPPTAPSTPANVASRRESLPTKSFSTAGAITTTDVPKRKKSVRFSEVGDDEGSLVTRIRLISPPLGGHAADDYTEDTLMQQEPVNVTTSLPARTMKLFIVAQRDPLNAVFTVTAHADSPQALLDEALGGHVLQLNYTCLADTLLQQLEGIREKILFSGTVTADVTVPVDKERLDTVSQRLKTMTAGLVLLKAGHAIILYPAQCERWSEEKFGFPAPEIREHNAPLRYVVFSTHFDGSLLLRPQKSTTHDFEIPSGVSEREYLMRIFTGLDHPSFSRLFPRRDAAVSRNAFLIFPPSLSPSMQQLAMWIRTMDPSCAVYCSNIAGAWVAFCDKISMASEEGVIIVHELATRAIRRFPNLNRCLVMGSDACRFWSLSQSILSPPLFAPIAHLQDSDLDRSLLPGFGRTTWTRLFPGGLAVLVTPSFIVSEPEPAHAFFRWISEAHRAGNTLITLVASSGICDYLLKAADEASRLLKEIQKDTTLTTPERIEAARRVRATVTDCQLRYDTWLLACEICETQATEYFRPIEYADKAIDGDDEQSLVNWFGFWSSEHHDRYRLFHVVGSDKEIAQRPTNWAKRKVPVPNFVPGTVADPDVAWERMRDAVDNQNQPANQHGPRERAPSDVQSALPAPASRSLLFPDSSPDALNEHLMEYSRCAPAKAYWRLYGYAVLWKDSNEAFQHGILHSESPSIQGWLKFVWPFAVYKFRTYVGFFNMIDDSCDKSNANGDKLARHPFVAVYRPVNPHLNSFTETEVIFWDVRAKSKIRSQDVFYEEDLSSAQRAVVEYLRENGQAKNKDMPLNRIFIGSESFKPANVRTSVLSRRREYDTYRDTISPRVNELDATMEFLDAMISDMKFGMPATGRYLEGRGFKAVKLRQKEKATDLRIGQSAAGDVAGEVAMEEQSNPADLKIVFHAPRGGHLRPVGTSKCRNRFYDLAKQARVQNPRQPTMKFDFGPTTEWYADQVNEDRGFEHMRVGSWREFFKMFGVENR